jgi:hypothetical protein
VFTFLTSSHCKLRPNTEGTREYYPDATPFYGVKGPSCTVRVSGRNLHLRMPLDLTHVRLKLLHTCDQWYFSRVATTSYRSRRKSRPNTEGTLVGKGPNATCHVPVVDDTAWRCYSHLALNLANSAWSGDAPHPNAFCSECIGPINAIIDGCMPTPPPPPPPTSPSGVEPKIVTLPNGRVVISTG